MHPERAIDEDGELYCLECGESVFTRGISNYELDEQETAWSEDAFDGQDGHVDSCECALPLTCSDCGGELTDGYVDPECKTLQDGEDA